MGRRQLGRFSYDLIPDTQLLLVSCGCNAGTWEIYATSDPLAVERADSYDECALDDVADGNYLCVEHEVWRVVDLPVDGEAYEVTTESLRALEEVASELETTVCSSCGTWDLRKLVTRTGEIVWGALTSEEETVLAAAIYLRRFVSNAVAAKA